ncbi:LysM peptidoglycan-binding domain-containing protein [Aquimarina sp. ERC-38]|uniref:amino acid ABC transporter substrate-binding protein n=1 Tax=Aquimarina sp. ERC-38 TaxID=2949996 RepID=UPI002246998F|nr:LysM peptidoglycan-binding domain-containing protein [Aquimarina sp. ERC-38]UZO79334.1 LysM peptidoglycan-binding domain-containing protein [Aquimarina sp. ERC-38]
MNLLKITLLLLLLNTSVFAQQYKSHKVEKGENVYRIAKRYNTTPEAIYKINPTSKSGIKEGEILAIPVIDNQEYETYTVKAKETAYSIARRYNISIDKLYLLNPEAVKGINDGQVLRLGKLGEVSASVENPVKEVDKVTTVEDMVNGVQPIKFKSHRVKRKETLFSIAQLYNISVEDIKKYNKQFYSESIKKKDKLKIPVYSENREQIQLLTGTSKDRLSVTTKYTIKPKDTKFSIARRHGITIKELESLNPKLDESLPIGLEITVPTAIFVPYDENIVEPGFQLYTIPPKETMFNLVRQLNIPTDSLLKMNPYIKDGLKAGMVIIIPQRGVSDSLAIDYAEGKAIDLESKLFNFKPKKLAVMLPFNLDYLDLDNREKTEEYLESRKAQGTKVALDFYKGILMAIDSAKTKGLTVDVTVYDTQKNNNSEYVKSLISKKDFRKTDVVLGPLYQANVETVAAALKSENIPVISPISNKESKLYGNFFQTIPSDELLQDKLIDFIKEDTSNKNIVIIVQSGTRFEKVKEKLTSRFPEAKVAKIEKGNYLYEPNLAKVLDKNKPNWVILESNDVAMISNVVPLLNAKASSHKITLLTTDKSKAYDDDSVKNQHLSRLKLHYPSVDKEYDNYDKEHTDPFVTKYQKKYGMIPNKYAVRGFDITYDLLMRLGTADNLFHAASVEGTTEYVESKFNYAKKSMGGYYNKAAYLIKFDDELKLKVID